MGGWGREMKQEGMGRETNHKRLLDSRNELRVAGRQGGRDRVAGLWTLGRVCAVKCCEMCKPEDSQTCTLGQIIHYMLIKI